MKFFFGETIEFNELIFWRNRAYIATQGPLQETMDDFWRMVWQHNSTIIVMLTRLKEMGREKCYQYWPNDRSMRYQCYVVDPIAEYNMPMYKLREFKVCLGCAVPYFVAPALGFKQSH